MPAGALQRATFNVQVAPAAKSHSWTERQRLNAVLQAGKLGCTVARLTLLLCIGRRLCAENVCCKKLCCLMYQQQWMMRLP